MSNTELLSKFRNMMNKKKQDETKEKEKTPTHFEQNEHQNSNNDLKVNTTISTIIKDEHSKINEIPNIIRSESDNHVHKPGRSSVFDVAKKFEARNKRENEVGIQENKKISSQDLVEVDATGTRNGEISQAEKDVSDGNEKLRNSNYYKERTSTNRNLMKNSLRKILGLENTHNNKDSQQNITLSDNSVSASQDKKISIDNHHLNVESNSQNLIKAETNHPINITEKITTEPENNNQSNPTSNIDSLKEHIITDIPRKSVHNFIKMNERRIQNNMEDKKLKQQQRNTVTQRFKTNVNDITKYLYTLRENPSDKIDSEEFLKKNASKLSQFGINEKDLPLVQDLISFYETNVKNAEREKEDQLKKQRNTVATGSIKRMNFNIPTIKEEKDEDQSLGDSMRNSVSQRKSSSIAERKSNPKSSAKNTHDQNILSQLNYGSNNSDQKNKEVTLKEENDSDDSFFSADSFDKHQMQVEFIGDTLTETENKEDLEVFNPKMDELQIIEEVLPQNLNKNCNQQTINYNKLPSDNTIDRDTLKNSEKFTCASLSEPLESSSIISLKFQSDKYNKQSSYNNLAISNEDHLSLKESGFSNFLKKKSSLKIDFTDFSIETPIVTVKDLCIKLRISHESQIQFNGIQKQQRKLLVSQDMLHYITPKKEYKRLLIENIIDIKLSKKIEEHKIINNNQIEYLQKKKEREFSEFKNENLTLGKYIGKEYLEDNLVKEHLKTENIENNIDIYPKNNYINTNENFVNSKNELLDDNKIQIQNFFSNNDLSSRYQKNIINALDSISVAKYNISSTIPLDPTFLDVICINCYECVKFNEVDLHSEDCVVQSEDNFRDLYSRESEEDYNARIYKLHESLKSKQNEIYQTKDEKLIPIYEELSTLIYEILINNNSIGELDKSISKLNEMTNVKLNSINSHYKFSMFIYAKRISQLVYTKLNDMEKILICVKNNNLADNASSNEEDNLGEEFEENEGDIENNEQIQMLKMELANLEKQTLNAKAEIEQWRQESKILENMLRKPNANTEMLSDIVSDVVSRRDESFDGMTIVTGQTSEYDNTDIANMKDVNEVLDLNNEEELKKYFLSIGLSLKFKYSEKIKENVSIADLYDKARSGQIPISTWYNFISQELKIN